MNENDHLFSFFTKPITNVVPNKTVGILDIYQHIISKNAKVATEELRSIVDSKEKKIFKAEAFDYCTFSGIFQRRCIKEIIRHSGLVCIDFDHVQNLEKLKSQLLGHPFFDTELLFISPSGDGLKWVISVTLREWSHSNYFKAIVNCLKSTGLPEVDTSGSDVARACLLPFDPNAYINPKYL